jgi:DNA mismatch repair protein MutS
LPGVKNYSVSVYETDKEVIFMKKIVKWWASKSYGLDVAKLAWIPTTIVENAREHLNNYEWPTPTSRGTEQVGLTNPAKDGTSDESKIQKKEFWALGFELWAKVEYGIKYEKFKSLLESVDLNTITPLQALQLLDKIKDELK